MDLKMKVNTATNYHLELRDTLTGKIKQTVDCHNVILNNFLNNVRNRSGVSTCVLGSGSGTPSASDTALFHQLWSISSITKSQTNPAKNRSVGTVTCVVAASPSYVGTITEIGLKAETLYTHALLVDAEGQPISISKTDTDELTVVVTIEFTESISLGSAQFKYPDYILNSSSSNYTLAQRLLGVFLYGYSKYNKTYEGPAGFYSISAYFTTQPLPFTDGYGYTDVARSGSFDLLPNYGSYVLNQDGEAAYGLTATFANGTITLSGNIRVTADSGIKGFYRYMCLTIVGYNGYNYGVHIGYQSLMGYFDLSEIWGPQSITAIPVGNGDGATADFALPLGKIVPESDTIYINGVAKTRGTDYTIDPIANPEKLSELSITYDAVSITGCTATAPYTSTDGAQSGLTPLKHNNNSVYQALLDKTKRSVWFDPEHPHVITLATAQPANYFLAYLELYKIRGSVTLEYSDDGTSWNSAFTQAVDVNTARTRVKVEHSWSEVTAKYWKLSVTSSVTGGFAAVNVGSASSTYVAEYPFYFGHYNQYGIHFNTPPADGDVLTMDCQIDIPYKSSNYAFNVAMNATLSV